MKHALSLFARLGLYSRKTDTPDHFALRLERTRSREDRREAKPVLFKTRSEPQEV